jgi:hypothetical protein
LIIVKVCGDRQPWIGARAWQRAVHPWPIARAKRVIERYYELDIGLADASMVMLAERHRTSQVLMLDELHAPCDAYRSAQALQGDPVRSLRDTHHYRVGDDH